MGVNGDRMMVDILLVLLLVAFRTAQWSIGGGDGRDWSRSIHERCGCTNGEPGESMQVCVCFVLLLRDSPLHGALDRESTASQTHYSAQSTRTHTTDRSAVSVRARTRSFARCTAKKAPKPSARVLFSHWL